MKQMLIAGLGGFIGSIGRYRLGGMIVHHTASWRFPVGTLVVNVLGGFAIWAFAALAIAVVVTTVCLALFVNKERALEESRAAQVTRQSQKLQKTLFDSVSHELKTPLAAISAALQQEQPDRAELQQAVGRLTKTVDNLLDATRLESGLLQPVCEWCDPGELVREAIASSGLRENDVQIQIAKNLPPILVDSRLIQQALDALLANAALYGKSEKPTEVGAARDDSTMVFSVTDHGPGLAPGEETKVFQKFYRGPITRPRGLGLGLGLSIARQLVEAHGGQIIAENRAAGGARFSIRLPLGEAMRLPAEATA